MYLETNNPESHIGQIVYINNSPEKIYEITSVHDIVNDIKVIFNISNKQGDNLQLSNFDLKDFNSLIEDTKDDLQYYKDLKRMFTDWT